MTDAIHVLDPLLRREGMTEKPNPCHSRPKGIPSGNASIGNPESSLMIAHGRCNPRSGSPACLLRTLKAGRPLKIPLFESRLRAESGSGTSGNDNISFGRNFEMGSNHQSSLSAPLVREKME